MHGSQATYLFDTLFIIIMDNYKEGTWFMTNFIDTIRKYKKKINVSAGKLCVGWIVWSFRLNRGHLYIEECPSQRVQWTGCWMAGQPRDTSGGQEFTLSIQTIRFLLGNVPWLRESRILGERKYIFQPYNSSNMYLSKKPTNYGQAQKPCMLETIQPLEVCVW